MSRLGYSEDEEFPGEWALWAANVARSLGSAKGMASLRELEAALVAMPSKRLVANVLAEGGEVCALGALVAVKAPALLAEKPTDPCDCTHERSLHTPKECIAVYVMGWGERKGQEVPCGCDRFYVEDYEQGERTQAAAHQVGVPIGVARYVIQLNDNDLERDTPEQRYEHVLAWVRRQLERPVKPREMAAQYGWYL